MIIVYDKILKIKNKWNWNSKCFVTYYWMYIRMYKTIRIAYIDRILYGQISRIGKFRKIVDDLVTYY